MIGTLTATALAGEKPKEAKEGTPEKTAPKRPSLDELRAIVEPMLDELDLSSDEKTKAAGAMSEEAWKAALATFDKKRGSEIFKATHAKIPELMPAVMMPKMMAYSMAKNMKERMATKAGPPSPKDMEAIRAAAKEGMRAKLSPAIMGNLEEMTAQRMQEVLADKKILVRALAETVADAALGDKQKEKLDEALTKAGYPGSLVHGPDPVLAGQVNKMVEATADKVIAELKKADESGKKSDEPSGPKKEK
jgi:hypothetical protein